MKKTISYLAIASAIILGAYGLTGCDTESADQVTITVTPNNARIKVGDSLTFTAHGFRDYNWSLSEPKIGVLSVNRGDSTVYTAVQPASNIVQVLTVTSTAVSSVISNQTVTVSAEALITHY